MKTVKGWKIYFNALLDDKKFNNETFKEIAEMLSLFYFNERLTIKSQEVKRRKYK